MSSFVQVKGERLAPDNRVELKEAELAELPAPGDIVQVKEAELVAPDNRHSPREVYSRSKKMYAKCIAVTSSSAFGRCCVLFIMEVNIRQVKERRRIDRKFIFLIYDYSATERRNSFYIQIEGGGQNFDRIHLRFPGYFSHIAKSEKYLLST